MAIAGVVAAGVTGSGALAEGASSHGREQAITEKHSKSYILGANYF
jgi:hypothetical protein